MESWVGERLSLEMYGELGRGRLSLEMYGELGRGRLSLEGDDCTRNVWSWVGGRLSLEMYGELGRGTTVTRNVWRVG